MNKTEHECNYEHKLPVKGMSYGCLLLVVFLVLSSPLLRFGEAKTMGAAVIAGTGNAPDLLEWSQLPPLPDPVGLAGPFVGVSNDVLIIAGGLSLQQVELLLAHELAHIRRYDPLVNILQRIIEAVLFLHPAVWFI